MKKGVRKEPTSEREKPRFSRAGSFRESRRGTDEAGRLEGHWDGCQVRQRDVRKDWEARHKGPGSIAFHVVITILRNDRDGPSHALGPTLCREPP